MGRKRKSNPLNLPPRVYPKHGAFYYHHLPDAQHPNGKWERLGTDLDKIKSRAGDITSNQGEGYGTCAYWYAEFIKHCRARVVAGTMAPRTLDDYEGAARYLDAFFGLMFPAGVEAPHIADYLDTNQQAGRGVRANREKAAFSSMFTWLIRNGKADVKLNPCRGVVRNKETKRDRYVEDDELAATMAHDPNIMVWGLSQLIYCTLQRPEDIITWNLRNITQRRDAGGRLVNIIRNDQGKTGKVVDIEITPQLEQILATLKAGAAERSTAKGAVLAMTLIHRRDGQPYTYSGLTAMLKRRQKGAGVKPFGYYDLKGKGATDMWQAGEPLGRIQLLCGHESITTTERYVKRRWRGIATPNQVAMAV